MKSNKFFLNCVAAIGFIALLAACGDDSTERIVEVSQFKVVEDESELPDCTDDNEGEHAYVKGESLDRVCVEGEWVALKDSGKSGALSCSTEELEDKSGLKILCNGDSVGVVLNGTNGKASEGCAVSAQTDSTVTITCGKESTTLKLGEKAKESGSEDDPEKVPTSLESLEGYTQKGPFLRGSTVYLYELESGRTLKQTNGNFTSSILSDDGRYRFLARDLVSQYAMLVVEGNYRNEVTGKVSDNKIRLKAITDLSKHTTANVNLLTDLEFERVYHLVTKKKNKVYEAKRTAQTEILDIFHMALTDKTDAEDMDVFGNSDADAALLAISILLQGDRTEAELMALLAEISLAMAETGKWEGARADSIKTSMADWAFGHDMSKFRKNVEGWGLSDKKPGNFEKFVEMFIAETYGISVCSAVSTAKQQVNNSRSIFHGKKYECYKDDGMTRATWVDIRRNNPYLKAGINYGHLIDWRDRRMYNTIEIGFHDIDDGAYYSITVMSENLDFEYRLNGAVFANICAEVGCDEDGSKPYGRYYSWGAAMDSAGLYSTDGLDCGEGKICNAKYRPRGVCPEGWYVPMKSDWDLLMSRIGANMSENDLSINKSKALKSETGWQTSEYVAAGVGGNGIDLYGFSAFPLGFAIPYPEMVPYMIEFGYPVYSENGRFAEFWSSTEIDAYSAYTYQLQYDSDGTEYNDGTKSLGSLIRCFEGY
jgi:uncharacterized protein (TIGR02145 family)